MSLPLAKLTTIRQLGHFLGVSQDWLKSLDDKLGSQPESLIVKRWLWHPKRDVHRPVVTIRGDFREFHKRFVERVLVKYLQPSSHNHGSVRGRSILTNANRHAESRFVYACDVEGFFPSINQKRVYALFAKLGCAPDVARLCVRLCTWDNHLAAGFPASPFLSDQVPHAVDSRINAACVSRDLTYTRFVDDITVSGSYPIDEGFKSVVESIVREHGFRINRSKTRFGRIGAGIPITGVEFKDGHPRPERRFLNEIRIALSDAKALTENREPESEFLFSDQIAAKLRYVEWICKGLAAPMWKDFRLINWHQTEAIARARGYVRRRPEITAVGARPSWLPDEPVRQEVQPL